MFLQLGGLGSDSDVQTDVDVAASGVRVRTDLVSGGYQFFRGGAVKARQVYVEFHFQAESAWDLADSDLAGDGGVGRDLALVLTGNELQGADEAG